MTEQNETELKEMEQNEAELKETEHNDTEPNEMEQNERGPNGAQRDSPGAGCIARLCGPGVPTKQQQWAAHRALETMPCGWAGVRHIGSGGVGRRHCATQGVRVQIGVCNTHCKNDVLRVREGGAVLLA